MVRIMCPSVCMLWACVVPVLVHAHDESTMLAPPPPPPPPPSSKPELYFLLMNQKINSVYNLTAVTAVFKRASAAGYTGVVLYDHNLEALGSPRLVADYLPSLRAVITAAHEHGLEVVPQIYSFGHSEGMVFYNISLAEPTPTTARFNVSPDRRRLVLADSTPILSNGNFTHTLTPNHLAGWNLQQAPGARTFSDSTVSHAGSGGSLRIESLGQGWPSARVMQQFEASPNGSVTARCWVKGDRLDLSEGGVDLRMQLNFDGDSNCERWTADDIRRACKADETNCSFSWRAASVTCSNVGDHASLQLWLGLWANSTHPGAVWFTGCELSAGGGVVNVLRRDGAPLVVRSVNSEAPPFIEGRDYDPIPSTAQSLVDASGEFPSNPVPVQVTLPSSTRMRPNETVEVVYYTVPGNQVAACMASPESEQYLVDSAVKHAQIFGEGSQYLVRYDEIVQMHACELCRAKADTAGDLLAWHATHSAEVLQRSASPRRVMVWQDMFDPFVNGNRTGYYRDIKGGITGAWKGLPRSWVVANWDHSNEGYNATDDTCVELGKCATKSLRWFESLGFSQLICGYYGSGNGTASAVAEIAAASGVDGLLGMMYGSWASGPVPGDPYLGGGDYSQLEAYAAAVRANWPTLVHASEQRQKEKAAQSARLHRDVERDAQMDSQLT